MKFNDVFGKLKLDFRMKVWVGVFVLVLVMVMGVFVVLVQDVDEEVQVSDFEVIVVWGIWFSLCFVQEICCNLDVLVDVVMVEDIGVLLDCFVLEVFQCVLGINIIWFDGENDLDYFFVEGLGVIICGLNFVCSELNGCDVFFVDNGQ